MKTKTKNDSLGQSLIMKIFLSILIGIFSLPPLAAQTIPNPSGAVLSYRAVRNSWIMDLDITGVADYRDINIYFCPNGFFSMQNRRFDNLRMLKEGTWSYDQQKGTISLHIQSKIEELEYGHVTIRASSYIPQYNERISAACDEIEIFEWNNIFLDYQYLLGYPINQSMSAKEEAAVILSALKSSFFINAVKHLHPYHHFEKGHLESFYSVDLASKLEPKYPPKNFMQVMEYPEKAILTRVQYSSMLTEPEKDWIYHPVHIIDNNPESAWFENKPGPGIGEHVRLSFRNLNRVDSIGINPGWMSDYYFIRNNRLKKVLLVINGTENILEIPDQMKEFRFNLPNPMDITDLKIIIKAVYPKTQWDDTPISGIQFYSADKQIMVSPGPLYAEYWKE